MSFSTFSYKKMRLFVVLAALSAQLFGRSAHIDRFAYEQSAYKRACKQDLQKKNAVRDQIAQDAILARRLQQQEYAHAHKRTQTDAAYARALQKQFDRQSSRPRGDYAPAIWNYAPNTVTPKPAPTVQQTQDKSLTGFTGTEKVMRVLWQTGPTCCLHTVKNASLIAAAGDVVPDAIVGIHQKYAQAVCGKQYSINEIDKARRDWSARVKPGRPVINGTWDDEMEFLLKSYLKVDTRKYAFLPPHGFLQKRKELLRRRIIHGYSGLADLAEAIICFKSKDKATLPFVVCARGHAWVIAVHKDTARKKLDFYVFDSGDGGRSHISKYRSEIAQIRDLLAMSDVDLRRL